MSDMVTFVNLHGPKNDVDALQCHQFTFPDGTRHVKFTFRDQLHPCDPVVLVAKPKTSDEFMDILLANDALKREGIEHIALEFPYVFGCRQDRVCVRGEPLSTRVYADLINSCGFDGVRIWDPHSDVVSGILNNCIVMPGIGEEVISRGMKAFPDLTLVSPDAGAAKKVWDIAVKTQTPMVQCEKHRDMATGKIVSFGVNCQPDMVRDKNLLIVDDCITNGGTFLGLKTELDKLGPKSVSLCVTHADHLTGLQNMCEHFQHVFVSDSRDDWAWRPKNLTVVKLRA